MRKVFLSYAWNDGSTVTRWLYQRINALDGWSAWMDHDLHADSVFSVELQQRINEADLVLAVLTPGANRLNPPSFVQKELGYATQPEVNKPVYAVKALPTMVPLVIWGVTYVEFLQEETYEESFQDLLQKISGSSVRRELTTRQREEAYLRGIARDEIHRRAAKFYAELSAEAKKPVDGVTRGLVMDAEAAAFLAELAADIHTQQRHSPDDDPDAQRVENFDQLSDALEKYPRVAIIGDPGSGKTTTLRRLAYTLAEAAAADETQPLPVYVPLGAYEGGDFAAFVDSYFGDLRLGDYLPQHPERLVMLLDGLNETAQEHMDAIETWLAQHPRLPVRLTCRKLDYVERELRLQRVDVQPLDYRRIQQFMQAYRLPETARDDLFWQLAGSTTLKGVWEKFKAKELTLEDFFTGERLDSGHPAYGDTTVEEDRFYNQMRSTGDYPGLLGLVRNPFLLTITISIYAGRGEIPRNRSGLFAAFVQKLFTERGRPAAEQQGLEWLGDDVLRAGLTALAFAMQEQQTGTSVAYDWAINRVKAALPGQDAAHLLYLAASAGILDRGRELRFVHQLLQEYFAAAGMKTAKERGVPASHFFPGERWQEPTGWEETALLLAGMDGDATEIVRWLTPVQPDLAYRCAKESGAPCAEDALQALYQPAEGARRSPYAVAEWGRLNHENDNRPGVGEKDGLPDIAWSEVIPPGEYPIGGDEDAWSPLPAQRYKLERGFQISQYPITNAQFEAFAAAEDGYRSKDHDWFEGLAADESDRQIREEPRFPYANHPRVDVNWYQAMAFCRWLSWKLGGGYDLDKIEDWMVRLPTEQEWEIATRGTESLFYPYGNEFDAAKGNTSETGIGQTSAVGIFPDGVSWCGAYDLSGNVFEWCLTDYRNPAQHPEAEDLRSSARRVLRGGSWNNNKHFARAASRYAYYPSYWVRSSGFRVLRPPSLES